MLSYFRDVPDEYGLIIKDDWQDGELAFFLVDWIDGHGEAPGPHLTMGVNDANRLVKYLTNWIESEKRREKMWEDPGTEINQ